jgi:hypothetical protein
MKRMSCRVSGAPASERPSGLHTTCRSRSRSRRDARSIRPPARFRDNIIGSVYPPAARRHGHRIDSELVTRSSGVAETASWCFDRGKNTVSSQTNLRRSPRPCSRLMNSTVLASPRRAQHRPPCRTARTCPSRAVVGHVVSQPNTKATVG